MLVTEARVDEHGTVVAEKIEVEAETLRALLFIYKGMLEANENGTGYSALVAQGMAIMKGRVTPELLSVI